jgi:hypothetical protein
VGPHQDHLGHRHRRILDGGDLGKPGRATVTRLNRAARWLLLVSATLGAVAGVLAAVITG